MDLQDIFNSGIHTIAMGNKNTLVNKMIEVCFITDLFLRNQWSFLFAV